MPKATEQISGAKISPCGDACVLTVRLSQEKAETINAFLEQNHESMDQFVNRAINKAMEGFAYIAKSRRDYFTSDASDFVIIKPAPKKRK